MKSSLQFQFPPRRQWRTLNVLAGGLLALVFFAPAAWANGTPYFLDPNGGATAGFDVGSGTYNEADANWNPNTNGLGTLVAFPGASPYVQMTFGNGGAFPPDLSGAFSIYLNGARFNGIAVNSPGIDVTLTGSGNVYPSTGQTWWVTNISSLTVNDTRQAFDTAGSVKGLNWNKEAIVFAGGGTFNFPTPFGANSTAANTENNPGGVVNLQMNAVASTASAGTYTGGFILTAGALNFASAGSADAFYGFAAGKPFALRGGTVDNTSGAPLVLLVGPGGYELGGDFTFLGSSSLDLGTAPVTNGVSPTITVTANTLAIGGVISGAGNGLTKVGNGTLQLYGANTYTGNTFVNAGTLALTNAGTIAASAQLAVSSATFDVSGLAGGSTTLAAYSPTNSTLTVAIVSTTATNVLAATVNVGGTTNLINITTLPLVTSYPQTYHVINGTTVNGTLNFGLGAMPSASPAYIGYITNRAASGSVDLVLTGGPAPVRALTWSGLSGGLPNGTWDVGNTPTWLDASSTPTTFNQLDIVTFNDAAAGQTTVNLSGDLTPGSLTVSNNALAYVFTGGLLSDGSGSLSLNKLGAGTLLLQESGDYFSGNIVAAGGTVIIDNDSSGITGGTIIGAGGTVQLGANDTAGVLPSGTVTADGALVFNRADNITVANIITGSGTISQVNTNVVTLSGASSGNWAVNLQNGTLQIVNSSSLGSLPGGAVTITNGGTLDVGGDGTQNDANFGAKQINLAGAGVGGNGAIINSGGTQQQNAFQNVVLNADATIGGANRWDLRGGTPLLDLAGHTLTKTNFNQISMVSPHVTSGNILIQQGILSIEATPNFDAGAGSIIVNNGAYMGQYKDTPGSFTRGIVLNGGGTTNLSGSGSVTFLDAPILLAASSTLGSAGGTEFFSGVISDNGAGFSLTNVGIGTNLLSAINTYSGVTFVTQGVLGLTNQGSLAASPLIIVNNGAAFDVSGLAIPFSGTNALWLGDDLLGVGTFNLGKTLVANASYISLSNAVVQLAVVNPNVACITVTNLNLGDGGAASIINITALPVLLPAQFPLIQYASVSGTYSLYLGTLPAGYSGSLVNNTANHSIDLAITGLPSGIWNGGSSADNDWSDPANWNGIGLQGNDALNFTGTARLNNTNDLSFAEAATSLTFLPGAGAFTLNGEPVALNGGITNSSSSLQTIDLGLSFGGSGTNFTFDGGSAGMILGGGLTNSFGAPGYTTLTLAGSGTLTNLLNSSTTPGGTNIFLMNSANANWTLADNAASAPITVPWDFQINAGTFNFGAGSSAPTLASTSAQGLPQDNQVGGVSGAPGTLNLVNGTWTTTARLNTAVASYSTGIVNQVGGTLNIGSEFQGANGATTNAQSIVNVSGGTLNVGGGGGQFYVASRDLGVLTVSNTAAVFCGNLDLSRNANGNARGSQGVVNLNGGTLTVALVGTATANSQTGPASSGVNPSATLNFNGGTLKARTNSAVFFQGSIVAPIIPITATVKSGGAIMDDGGFAISVLEPLQHDSSLGATPDGGLVKQGAGTMTLTAASTYTGNTVVSNGTLVVNGSLAAASAVTVTANGTLSGTGLIGGTVTVNGTITPGTLTTNGYLTCAAGVTINGTSAMKLDKINLTNDVLSVGGNLAFGGTLNVSLLSGTPALNDNFKLFSAASYSGNFAVTNLPALAGGLAWNWNPANGALSVVSGVNPNPTNLTATVSGGGLTLAWPADHTGWTLQCQTNALGAGLSPAVGAWFDVAGSTGVNTTNITIDPAQPTVFYRLKL